MAQSTKTLPKGQPTIAELKQKIGPSYRVIDEIVAGLEEEFSNISCEWRYSEKSGWFLIYNKARKHLFYLFPDEKGFRLRMVLSDRALERAKQEEFPKPICDIIEKSRKYPEGWLCEFNHSNCRADKTLLLLRLKISS